MQRAGKRSAEDVYRALAPAVLGYFRGHRMADAEDLTGDVFVNVTEHLGRFHGGDAALRRWVFTVAHHRMVDEFRRVGRASPVSALLERWESVDQVPFDEELVRALAELNDDQREVVVLRFVGDLSLKEVAKITGRRVGAVKMAQGRGLDTLRVALSARGVAGRHPADL